MRTLWRISNHTDLSGWGGRKFSSRWASLGKRVVYLAESPPGALLEVLVHIQFEEGELPDEFQLIQIAIPEEYSIRELEPSSRLDWKEHPNYTQHIGDAWLASMETPLARVPSAIVPRTWNYVLNPLHPQAKQIVVAEVIRERFDNRLFRFGSR